MAAERRIVLPERNLWVGMTVCMVSGLIIGFGFAVYLGFVWGLL
jgi:tetrahydromethanopterin S-methyltransferase subunit F